MGQTQKPEVRSRLQDAALAEFCDRGFEGATVGGIATRANMSTGNVYRYIENKTTLFESIIDDAFICAFDEHLDARVTALAKLDDLRALDLSAEQRQEDLLSFWVRERQRVVILLDRAEGTRSAGYGARFVERLVTLSYDSLARKCQPLPRNTKWVLRQIFDNTRRTVVAILEKHKGEAAIRNAFAAFWRFQLAGLEGFAKGLEG